MSLSKADHTTLGRALYEAMRSEVPIKPLIQSHPAITIEDAYQISRVMLSLRMEQDGETIVGKKIGVTSAVSYTHLRAPRDLSTARMPSSA